MHKELEKLSIKPTKVVSICFTGHVDCGKSTISGRIMVDLGYVDKRTLEKYREEAASMSRESWALSWALDVTQEEREKGKTSELGLVSLQYKDTLINVLDTPGHAHFITQMIEGASSADVAVLVLSGMGEEFQDGMKGTTEQHITLLKAANIRKLIILVNKMDKEDWNKEKFDSIIQQITPKLTFFKILGKIPVSGITGDNLVYKKDNIFYKGPCFLDLLQEIDIKRAEYPAFTVVDRTRLLYGKLESGLFSKGEEVLLLPSFKKDKIMEIFDAEEVEVSSMLPGQMYKIRLEKNNDITVGSKIVDLESPYKKCNKFSANILNVSEFPILPYSEYILHIGSMKTECRIKGIYFNRKKRSVARKNDRVLVVIETEDPVVVLCNENEQNKFSLRDAGNTIAGGTVHKIIK